MDRPYGWATLRRIFYHPVVYTVLFSVSTSIHTWYRWLVNGLPPLWESVPLLILSAGVGLVFGTLLLYATGEVVISKRARNTRLFIGITLVTLAILAKLIHQRILV